ncbi:MAG: biosynthetic-type acetolactate synthase large subunit [Candidatus Bathyarchaeia archaeon]
MKGARILLESLKKEGVKVIFGIPGGATIPIYDELYNETEIRHILMRHEQGAAHAADGYARASGKPGVCMATSGPGATNLITGIATAYMDSSPVISIAGQVPTFLIGTDAFQEADLFSLMLPITKINFLIKKTEEIPRTVKMAFEIACSGRPGPVHIDIPRDVQVNEAEFDYPTYRLYNYEAPKPSIERLKKAAEMLMNSEKPILMVGGGAIFSGASEEILKLAELLQSPVVTTLMGKGSIPENHPLCLGMLGMHGSRITNLAVQECDLLFAIGVRFDDRATGKVQSFATKAKIIQLDIDPSEIGKNVRCDLPIIGDAKQSLRGIIDCLIKSFNKEKRNAWKERLEELRKENPPIYFDEKSIPIKPPVVIKSLMNLLNEDDIITTEVGQCQMWAAIYYKVRKPRKFISSGGLGTMGFGFPAAIGAKMACPNCRVVDVAGDGSFLMNCNQLATAVEEEIPVVVVILDNRYLGMVRQWQELFFKKRYSGVYLGERTDFVKLAESFGAKGWRVERPSELEETLKEALNCGEPAVVDVLVEREMNVFPIVAPGASILEMIGKDQVLT